MKIFFSYIGIKRCSLCNKRKIYLYDIPIYNDITEIIHCGTKESYLTCWKCIHELLQTNVVIISLKSFVQKSVNDMSLNSQNTMNNLIQQDIFKKFHNSQNSELKMYNYANYLTDEEHETMKRIIHKINQKTMC